MKVLWAIVCEGAIIDRDTNNVSLINIIDEITIPVPPPETPSESSLTPITVSLGLKLVLLWARSNLDVPEKGQGRVRVLDPANRESLSGALEIDLTDVTRVRVNGDIPEMVFFNPGQHLLKVEGKVPGSDWKEMFELPLTVSIQTQDAT